MRQSPGRQRPSDRPAHASSTAQRTHAARARSLMAGATLVIAPIVMLAKGPIATAQDVLVPPGIRAQVLKIEDRFRMVLEEECPAKVCSPVGCDSPRFVTIDASQNAALPGLEMVEQPEGVVQHRLTSVRCEFTYEPTLTDDALDQLRQRVMRKVSSVSATVNLISRELDPAPDLNPKQPADQPPPTPPQIPKGPWQLFYEAMIPFLPWFFTALLLAYLAVYLMRALRPQPVQAEAPAPKPDEATRTLAEAVPATTVLLAQVQHLKDTLHGDPQLAELVLRPLLEERDLDELCLVLRHCGPEPLAAFKRRPQYFAALAELSEAFHRREATETPAELWHFLERMERRCVAAKVRMDYSATESEFAFMSHMDASELAGLIAESSTEEAVVALTQAPKTLRESFFATAPAETIERLAHALTHAQRLSDDQVRAAATRLRGLYEANYGQYHQVEVDQVPLLEQALNALDTQKRTQVLTGVIAERPELAQGARLFLDVSLTQLPDEILAEALLTTRPEAAAAYLDTIDGGRDLLDKVTPRLAATIRRFKPSNTPDLSLVEEARAAISTFVKHQDEQGAIDLAAINARLLNP